MKIDCAIASTRYCNPVNDVSGIKSPELSPAFGLEVGRLEQKLIVALDEFSDLTGVALVYKYFKQQGSRWFARNDRRGSPRR